MESDNEDSQIKLVDCGLEQLVSALLARQPIHTLSGSAPFVLKNNDSRRILSYYARHRDLWSREKVVQAREIEDLLGALAQDIPAQWHTKPVTAAAKRLWKLRRLESHRFAGLHRHWQDIAL